VTRHVRHARLIRKVCAVALAGMESTGSLRGERKDRLELSFEESGDRLSDSYSGMGSRRSST